MKKTLTALAIAATLGLTACGDSGDPVKNAAPAPEQSTSASAAPKETKTPKPTKPAKPKEEIAEFGESFTYEDGLEVRIDIASSAQASEWAAGADATGGQMYLFEATIINGTEEIFDPSMFHADVNYGTTGTAASRVFDTNQGIGDSFQGKILPGGTQTVTMAYAIPTDAPQDILFIASPSWDHNESMFFGTAVQL